jgi:hypothetical protein
MGASVPFRRFFQQWYSLVVLVSGSFTEGARSDPSPAGGAFGRFETAGTRGDALGPNGAGRHQLFDFFAAATGAFRRRVVGRENQGFELAVTFFAAIFINRHCEAPLKEFCINIEHYGSFVKGADGVFAVGNPVSVSDKVLDIVSCTQFNRTIFLGRPGAWMIPG